MDIVHTDFHTNPMRILEQVYAFIGLEIGPELHMQFAQRIAEKPEMAHGVHRYDIANYGMSEDEVREIFGDYMTRFDLMESQR